MGEAHRADLLASIVLLVTPPPAGTWTPLQLGPALHAFFYDTVAVSNPTLAHGLHHAARLKPFTVSLPLPWPNASVHAAPLSAIRFTTLTREVYEALVEGMLRRCQASSRLALGPHEVEIQHVLFRQESAGLATVTCYEELSMTPPVRTIHMQFLTPTSFRTGRGSLPLPLPASVYRSLWEKWQCFAPPALRLADSLVPTITQHLFPARYALHTAVMRHKDGVPQVGCVGWCQFQLLGELSDADWRALTALSRFATYAGVGMKTTMGMGHTVVQPDAAAAAGSTGWWLAEAERDGTSAMVEWLEHGTLPLRQQRRPAVGQDGMSRARLQRTGQRRGW